MLHIMRGALCMALAAGALAHPQRQPRQDPAPLPTSGVPFTVISLQEALASLQVKAIATPSAVSLRPGVSISIPPIAAASDAAAKRATPVKREVANARAVCSSPTTVYEWRSLSDADKLAFSTAIKCLQTKPSRSGISGAQNRWDDLTGIHQKMTPTIHSSGQFLPWHRYFLWIFEQELRGTCGYTGPMAWWDETKDAGHFGTAPPFTSQYFGSMPVGSNQCIGDGQFANLVLHLGPGSGNSNHCLARGCNEQTSSQCSITYLNICWSYTGFNDMQKCIDGGVHAAGHNAIGGNTMNDVYASPNDPTFYLHHGFINRAWRFWQLQSSSRINAIGGYTTTGCQQGTQILGCRTVTLDYQLTSLNFYPAVSVRDVMDTKGGFLCYDYDY